MTNEEKARIIWSETIRDANPGDFSLCIKSALKMAEWKDEQFKEYLEKLIKEFSDEEAGYFVIKRIINKLFKEEQI